MPFFLNAGASDLTKPAASRAGGIKDKLSPATPGMMNRADTSDSFLKPLKGLTAGLFFLAVYVLAGKFGLSWAFRNASASPIWPPTGIALAAVLLGGYRFGFAIFFAAFLVNITTQGSLITSLAIGGGNTLEALVGAWLITRFSQSGRYFSTPREILKFALLGAVLSTTFSATVGITSLCLGGFTPWTEYGASWLTWWLGDLVSDLTIAPLVLIWALQGVGRWQRVKWLEAIALAVTIVVTDALVFFGGAVHGNKNFPIGYLALLPALWAAFRFGNRGAITAAIVTSGFALVGTLHGWGPFIGTDLNASLILAQAFVATITLTSLLVAAVVSEQKSNEQTLRADLDERKRAEHTRARLWAIIESSDDAILSKDMQGKIITWNNAAQQMFGYGPEEIIGQHIFRIVPPELQEQEEQMLERLRRGESIRHYETWRLARNGARIPVSLTISPVKDANGNIIGASSIARDITQRKQAEEALQKAKAELQAHAENLEKTVAERTAQLRQINAELEAFSFSLSHDLRAPLRAIRGFTLGVLEERRSQLGDSAADLDRVINSAKRMDRLIQDVLAFSRVSRRDFASQKLDVEKLILAITSERPDLQPPRAEIQIAGPLPPIRGDEASLSQCVANLLENAVKFVPPGVTPKVVIRSEPISGKVRLWFEDNGIGIEKNQQPSIFEMFKRAHAGAQYEGSGLGLAIVRKAVERMGGTVGVESEPGKGSRFWLELPKAQNESAS